MTAKGTPSISMVNSVLDPSEKWAVENGKLMRRNTTYPLSKSFSLPKRADFKDCRNWRGGDEGGRRKINLDDRRMYRSPL